MNKHVAKILLTVFLSAALPSYSNENRVSVVTLGNYAPFCFYKSADIDGIKQQIIPPGTDSEQFQGYSWDVLRETFHEQGYTIELSVLPWKRALATVRNGQADILFPTGVNAERQEIFYYSQRPINESRFLVYVKKNSPFRWSGLDSLKGHTIGIRRAFNYGDLWMEIAPSLNLLNVDSIRQGFLLLDKERIEGFVSYEFNSDYFLNMKNWTRKYRKLPVFDSSSEYAVALKTNPRAQILIKDFNTGMERLVKYGKMKRIKEKWLGAE